MKTIIAFLLPLILCISCSTSNENPFLGKWKGVEIESNKQVEVTRLNFTLDFHNDKDVTYEIVRDNYVFSSENYNYNYYESDSLIEFTSEAKDTIPNIGPLKKLIRFKVKSIMPTTARLEDEINDSLFIKWDLTKL